MSQKTAKTCPITGLRIPRRAPVHRTVFSSALTQGLVVRNPQPGTLRRYVYVHHLGGVPRKRNPQL